MRESTDEQQRQHAGDQDQKSGSKEEREACNPINEPSARPEQRAHDSSQTVPWPGHECRADEVPDAQGDAGKRGVTCDYGGPNVELHARTILGLPVHAARRITEPEIRQDFCVSPPDWFW